MEVEVKIKGTADELFSLLMNSIKHDIESATGEDINLEELVSGYRYEKNLTNKLGKEGSATGTLTTINPPTLYEAAFQSKRGINRLSYKLEQLDDDTLHVTYSETYEPVDKNSELNFKFVNLFYRRSFRRRSTQMLKLMEIHIQEQRKNCE